MKQFWIVLILIVIFVTCLLIACVDNNNATHDQHDSIKPQIKTVVWAYSDDASDTLVEKENIDQVRIYDRHGHHISDSDHVKL